MTDDPWKKPDPEARPPQPPQGPQPPPEYAPPPGYGPQPGYGPPPPGYAPPPPGYGPPQGYAPPGYGPPQGYAPAGYAGPYGPPPPFDPNNPYAAPPARRSIRRLVWTLSISGLLLLGGCGVAGYFLFDTLVRQNVDAVNAFLGDVRDQKFDSAFDRLCRSEQAAETRAGFKQPLQDAVARDHRVTSFDINSSETTSTNGVTLRRADGSVSFSDGRNVEVTFRLRKESGHLCISSGYVLLE